MNSKDYRNLQEAYLDVYEQEITLKGTGPRLQDPYNGKRYDGQGGPKGGGTIRGPKRKNVIKKKKLNSMTSSFHT